VAERREMKCLQNFYGKYSEVLLINLTWKNRHVYSGDETEADPMQIKYQNRRCIEMVQNHGDWKEKLLAIYSDTNKYTC
jgi:hypothetical protein